MTDLLLGGRWLLAVVLIAAALPKLPRHARGRVAEAIRRYGLVPRRLAKPAAVALPWMELSCGVLLCLGIALVITASLVAAMLGVFAVAVGWHVARGHAFDCGCGSGGTPISWGLAGRDLMLFAISLAIAFGPSGALAVWPGWGAVRTLVSSANMIPVPLITILGLLCVRLGISTRQASSWRSSHDLQLQDV